ncbi:hypothetical protein [Rhizobium oryzicola]|uniref:Uncharacterized protein n=1 Tax=Rhizobium oryzicola TaxID=1232668 RepID=A0ABT8T0Y6_9HYPH|nr:hypothetical protein [Rhizobium oryzicola]MDO1584415.1 hypothetical protein [Rhizobium oryzicola]
MNALLVEASLKRGPDERIALGIMNVRQAAALALQGIEFSILRRADATPPLVLNRQDLLRLSEQD